MSYVDKGIFEAKYSLSKLFKTRLYQIRQKVDGKIHLNTTLSKCITEVIEQLSNSAFKVLSCLGSVFRFFTLKLALQDNSAAMINSESWLDITQQSDG